MNVLFVDFIHVILLAFLMHMMCTYESPLWRLCQMLVGEEVFLVRRMESVMLRIELVLSHLPRLFRISREQMMEGDFLLNRFFLRSYSHDVLLLVSNPLCIFLICMSILLFIFYSSVTEMPNGPIDVASEGTKGANISDISSGSVTKEFEPYIRSGGNKRSNIMSGVNVESILTASLSDVGSPASDPVLVPPNDACVSTAVGAVKLDVGSPCSLVELNLNIPPENKSNSGIDRFPHL